MDLKFVVFEFLQNDFHIMLFSETIAIIDKKAAFYDLLDGFSSLEFLFDGSVSLGKGIVKRSAYSVQNYL